MHGPTRDGSAASFLPVLAQQFVGRPGWFLIGGTAVHFWAERYLPRHPRLQIFTPFRSKDIDICVTDTEEFRAELPTTTHFPAGIIGHNPQFGGEWFRWIPGLPYADLEEQILTLENGVHLASPALLLKSKVWNLFNIPQEGRADARHAAILGELLPLFFDDPFFDPAHAVARQRLASLHHPGIPDELHTLCGVDLRRWAPTPQSHIAVHVLPEVSDAEMPHLAAACPGHSFHRLQPPQHGQICLLADHPRAKTHEAALLPILEPLLQPALQRYR